MHTMVAAAIQARRNPGNPGSADDLLDYMLSAQDPETGQRMTMEDLVYNMQFFIVAGHETTALALSWALYLLANMPEIQERAREEIVAPLGGCVAGAADIAAMPLRPANFRGEACGFIHRWACLPGLSSPRTNCAAASCVPMIFCFFPFGPCIATNCCGKGRTPSILTVLSCAQDRGRDKYQYLPFGAGPRVCVGANFAMMQAQIILATLIQRFRFRPGRPEPKPIMTMTVRPDPGVFLEVLPLDG